ncbi:hypothetical protein PMIN06_010929 [Paraphaeosphaeria minitans]
MSEPTANSKRRAWQSESEHAGGQDGSAAEARKRRAFLQTMGQQLREFGASGTSPQDHARFAFGTSPSDRPTTRGAPSTTAPVQHVETPVEVDAAPGEDDQLPAGAAKSAAKWLWDANEVHPVNSGRAEPSFTFEDLLDWSQSYFDHWHPAFPFVHAPSLLDHFRQTASRGPVSSTLSPSDAFQNVILRSVMSISIADRRQMKIHARVLPSTLVFHSFNDAINSTMAVLTEESSILSLQALVSVQLFLLTMHRYNAASRLEGLAVRIAFQLDLHRCPLHTHPKADKETELCKRLFWSIFCIDRYICIRLGNPLGMRSDDVDVCYPHTERHGDTSINREDEDTGRDDRLDLLEFLAQHASIRGSIMENRSRSAIKGNRDDVDNAMQTEAEHAKWWNTVDEYLSNDEQTQNITKIHQVTLIVLRFESILALHRSLLAASRKDAAYNSALQRCITASRSVINTLHKALKGFGAFDGSPGVHGYESTPLLWPSFTWAVWMSTFVIISAATEEQVHRGVALRLAEKSIKVLRHLALRGTSWPEACIVAIENLSARLNGVSTRSSSIGPRNSSTATLSINGLQRAQNTSREDSTVRGHPHYQAFSQAASQYRAPGPSMQPFTSVPYQDPNTSTIHFTEFVPMNNRNFDASTHGLDFQNHASLASAHLGGAGNFLGLAQQSSDIPRPGDDIMQLFSGEDIASWNGGNLGFGSLG